MQVKNGKVKRFQDIPERQFGERLELVLIKDDVYSDIQCNTGCLKIVFSPFLTMIHGSQGDRSMITPLKRGIQQIMCCYIVHILLLTV